MEAQTSTSQQLQTTQTAQKTQTAETSGQKMSFKIRNNSELGVNTKTGCIGFSNENSVEVINCDDPAMFTQALAKFHR